MHFIPIDLESLYKVNYFAINPNFGITFFSCLIEKFAIMSFSRAYYGSQDCNLFTIEMFHSMCDDLLVRIFYHLLPRDKGIRFAHSRIKQSQKVINFCSRTDRRSRIPSCGLLFDRYYRAEAINFLYIWSIHRSDKLARIG